MVPDDPSPPGPAETEAARPLEPGFAERAHGLLREVPTGTLATQSRREPGYPFASVMPFALDAAGRPVLLLSRLAVHAQNLAADARASLLVAAAGGDADPLATARVTLLGDAAPITEPADLESARAAYLERHPRARAWAGFGDFGFWRLEPRALYFVAGFGAMGWVEAEAYRLAVPGAPEPARRGGDPPA